MRECPQPASDQSRQVKQQAERGQTEREPHLGAMLSIHTVSLAARDAGEGAAALTPSRRIVYGHTRRFVNRADERRPVSCWLDCGEPPRNRTENPQIKSLLLCQLS